MVIGAEVPPIHGLESAWYAHLYTVLLRKGLERIYLWNIDKNLFCCFLGLDGINKWSSEAFDITCLVCIHLISFNIVVNCQSRAIVGIYVHIHLSSLTCSSALSIFCFSQLALLELVGLYCGCHLFPLFALVHFCCQETLHHADVLRHEMALSHLSLFHLWDCSLNCDVDHHLILFPSLEPLAGAAEELAAEIGPRDAVDTKPA